MCKLKVKLSLGFSLAVDESTGLLSLAQALDRETVPYFRVLVVVTDQGPGFNQATVCFIAHFSVVWVNCYLSLGHNNSECD